MTDSCSNIALTKQSTNVFFWKKASNLITHASLGHHPFQTPLPFSPPFFLLFQWPSHLAIISALSFHLYLCFFSSWGLRTPYPFSQSSKLLLWGKISAVVVLDNFPLFVSISSCLSLHFPQEGNSSLSCWVTLVSKMLWKDSSLKGLLMCNGFKNVTPLNPFENPVGWPHAFNSNSGVVWPVFWLSLTVAWPLVQPSLYRSCLVISGKVNSKAEETL